MNRAELGTSGLMIDEIILGTWAIGGSMWSDHDEEMAVKSVERAIELGMTTIDTAPVYGAGHAEEIVGKVVRGKRKEILIATKCGLDIENGGRRDLRPEFIRHDLEQSLKRLGTDYVDLYQIHWPDKNVSIEYTMAELVKFREEGKVRHLGVCNFSGEQLEAASAEGDIVSLQPHYSLLERSIESEIMELCREKNIGIISYGSLGAGMLTGKYSEPPLFPKNDARSFFYRFFKPKYWDRVSEVVATVREIAEEHHASPGHVAIAWILSKSGVAGAIVGARKPEQVEDNFKAQGLVLTEEETAQLDAVSEGIYEK